MNNEKTQLSTALERIGNNVDAIRDLVGGTVIEDVVANVGKCTKANNETEMGQKNPEDGSLCVIYDENETRLPWEQNDTKSAVMIFPKVIPLDPTTYPAEETWTPVRDSKESGSLDNTIIYTPGEGITVDIHEGTEENGYSLVVQYSYTANKGMVRDFLELYVNGEIVNLCEGLDTVVLPDKFLITGMSTDATTLEIIRMIVQTKPYIPWEVNTVSNLIYLPEAFSVNGNDRFYENGNYNIYGKDGIVKGTIQIIDNGSNIVVTVSSGVYKYNWKNTYYDVDVESSTITNGYTFDEPVIIVKDSGSSSSSSSGSGSGSSTASEESVEGFQVSAFVKTVKRNVPTVYMSINNGYWQKVGETDNNYQC